MPACFSSPPIQRDECGHGNQIWRSFVVHRTSPYRVERRVTMKTRWLWFCEDLIVESLPVARPHLSDSLLLTLDAPCNMFKLGVPIRMLFSFNSLAVRLQAVTRILQQSSYGRYELTECPSFFSPLASSLGSCTSISAATADHRGWPVPKDLPKRPATRNLSAGLPCGRPPSVSAGPAEGRLPHAVRESHFVSCDRRHPSPWQRQQSHPDPKRAIRPPPNDDARVHRDSSARFSYFD